MRLLKHLAYKSSPCRGCKHCHTSIRLVWRRSLSVVPISLARAQKHASIHAHTQDFVKIRKTVIFRSRLCQILVPRHSHLPRFGHAERLVNKYSAGEVVPRDDVADRGAWVLDRHQLRVCFLPGGILHHLSDAQWELCGRGKRYVARVLLPALHTLPVFAAIVDVYALPSQATSQKTSTRSRSSLAARGTGGHTRCVLT